MSDEIGRTGRRNLDRNIAKARRRDSLHAFSKLTHEVGGERRFVSDLPLLVPLAEFEEEAREDLSGRLRRILHSYQRSLQHDRRVLLDQFHLVDVARKVVGVGSVGTDAWIALFVGRDDDDPLILQIKEAQASVLEEFVGASAHRNAGERVVAGQRITQATGDIFLGWMRVKQTISGASRDYYVRQLRDWKGSVVVEAMRPRGMAAYGRVCGATLARAHARSGDRIAIAAYLGSGTAFDRAILRFSEAYAEQNARDYAALVEAVGSGRVAAQAELWGRAAPVGFSSPAHPAPALLQVDEPVTARGLAVGHHQPAGLEHQLVVVAVNRPVGPPQVLHQPVVAHRQHPAPAPVEDRRVGGPVGRGDHAHRAGGAHRAQPPAGRPPVRRSHGSWGVRAQRRSGRRDQGSISTARSIAWGPWAARTWRMASRARARRSSAGEGMAVS